MNRPDPPFRRDEFPPPFTLGPWLVQAELNRVSGPEAEHQVEPRVMRVLLCLATTPGSVWTRQDLLDAVWSDTIVGEEILTRAISELRRIFGDKARDPRYIETIRNHGYRLIATPEEPSTPEAPVTPAEPETPEPVVDPAPQDREPAPQPEPPGRRTGHPSSRRWFVLVVSALVLIVILGPRIMGLFDRPEGVVSRPEPVPLTSFPGREWHPALSPDGTRVAFVWSGAEGGRPALHVKQRNSETPLRLTDQQEGVAWPTWSPDGQTLVFAAGDGEQGTICRVPSLGGTVQVLQTVPSWVEGMDFAPDGRSLYYAARDGRDGPYRLFRLDLGSLEATALFTEGRRAGDFQPRISPDGSRVAWIGVGPGGHDRIHVADLPDGRPRPIGRQAASLQGLDFTPDGGHLVFSASPTGVFQLWKMALDGGDEAMATPIPTPGAFAWNPRVARRDGGMVFEEVRTDQDIWRVRITEIDPLQLETGAFLRSTRWEQEARISPDGSRVAFISSRTGSPQLWLAQADGSEPLKLTELAVAGLHGPRFSPAGDMLAFNIFREGRWAIMTLATRGGEPRLLTPDGASELLSGYAADGRSLLVAVETSDGWSLARRFPDSGELRPIMDLPGVTAVESVDGDRLYFTRSDRRGLWSLPLNETGRVPSGSEARLILADLPSGHRQNWTIADGHLNWMMRTAGTTMLVRTDLQDGRSRLVGELPGSTGDGLAVSRDGSTILYPRTGPLEGDLMLLERF